ncbi:MAG: carboxypeptidase regulatory-like domain-containing protein [Gemmatimonadaceae bacterium]
MAASISGALAAALLLCASPASGSAQTFRGTLTSQSGGPLGGVVVEFLAGQTVAVRGLSGDDGKFEAVLQPGVYRLRARRIGFRPFTSEPIPLGRGAVVTQVFALAEIPLRLDTVRVSGRERCRAFADSALATYQLWEQVRAALTAASLTAQDEGVDATVLKRERAIDVISKQVRQDSALVIRGMTNRIWQSPSADSLHTSGYVVVQSNGAYVYHGPDIDVLLSDVFLSHHCFRPATGRSDRIGIAFEPDEFRRNAIAGTLWLDRRSSELRLLEFRYVNVPRDLESARAGGEIHFARLEGGAWVISRWMLRGPGRTYDEIHTVSGELTLAVRGEDTLWTTPGVPLSGTVTELGSNAPLKGARVGFRGTPYQAVADSLGFFFLKNAPIGEFTMEVRTAATEPLGPLHQMHVTVTDTIEKLRVRVRPEVELASTVCGSAGSSTTGVIVGSVSVRDDSLPPWNVAVSAQWADSTKAARSVRARTDANGVFRLCGVPIATPLALRAEGSHPRAVSVIVPQGKRFVRADVMLEGRP